MPSNSKFVRSATYCSLPGHGAHICCASGSHRVVSERTAARAAVLFSRRVSPPPVNVLLQIMFEPPAQTSRGPEERRTEA